MNTAKQPDQHYEFVEGALYPLSDIRKWLRACLSGHRADLVADATLLVTELVSNAYEHAGGVLDVRLRFLPGDVVRFEVDDASDRNPPSAPVCLPGVPRGRGLVLVCALCTSWGVVRQARHKTVWAEFALEGTTDGIEQD